MYHALRKWHRVIGLINSLFLLLISFTGFFLALKAKVAWVRPEEKHGSAYTTAAEIISVEAALQAAFAQNLPKLQTHKDVDRVDYRPKRNVFKIVSKEGYHEVQVDGKTGDVLQVAQRTDQFLEDIHDLSIFHDSARELVLPIVAVSLFLLSLSGICIFFVPIIRRRKFAAKKAA